MHLFRHLAARRITSEPEPRQPECIAAGGVVPP
jgi:hypothetical protein